MHKATELTPRKTTQFNDVSITVLNMDSHEEQTKIFQEIKKFDLVITSPPWPGYNNACNDVGGIDNKEWERICNALSKFCLQANGIEGVRGAIELPGRMTQASRDVLERNLKAVGLQVGGRLESKRWSGHGNTTTHDWWIVLDKQLVNHLRSLERKAFKVTAELNKRSTPAKNSRGLKAWKRGASKWSGGLHFQAPSQFPISHLKAIISTYATKGSVVVDPYAGTGTCLETCAQYGVHSIGIEKVPAYAEGIRHRVEEIAPNRPSKKTSATRGAKSRIAYQLLRTEEEVEALGLVDKETFIQALSNNMNKTDAMELLKKHHVPEYRRKIYQGKGRGHNLYRKPEPQGA